MASLQRLESLFGVLLPPASREHVLGDLREKCRSRKQYVVEAAGVLGPVIFSRIRRTTDVQVFLMEAFAVYLSFSAAAWGMGQQAFLYQQAGFVRLAIPTLVTVIGLLLCNAYRNAAKAPSVRTAVLETVGSLSAALLGQAMLLDTRSSFGVPLRILLYGGSISFVLLSTLRMFFPPVRNGGAKIAVSKNASISQKRDLFHGQGLRVHRRIGRIHLPQGSTTATTLIWLFAVLLVLAICPQDARVFTPPHVMIVGLVLVVILHMRSG